MNEDQFVIPSYQRPYSWEYDQCFQLYTDLMEAFAEKNDYFIGNIILANSQEEKGRSYLVDGQQRLITIWLLLKILYIFFPELTILKRMLSIESWDGTESKAKIQSQIFEAQDNTHLETIFSRSKESLQERLQAVSDKQGHVQEWKCNSRIEANALLFYYWFSSFVTQATDDQRQAFVRFLLEDVYLLPIELFGQTLHEANNKALTIFETINNRGMNLEDADIFKAKLYNKAEKIGEGQEFIRAWIDFKSACDSLYLSIDDIFRFYSHVIRGHEGITTSEKNLREFFTHESYSPLLYKGYQEILDDLFHILEILQYLNQEVEKPSQTGAWLQIINAYTNQYPKFAIVVYLYVYGWSGKEDEAFITFLKSLVRYIYVQGSTTTIKFEIYNIIKQISNKATISDYYRTDINPIHFDTLGRLKKGFALLAFYLETPQAIPSYSIDKIIGPKDFSSIAPEWPITDYYSIADSLGNLVVLDIPKKSLSWEQKIEYYKHSHLESIKQIWTDRIPSYSQFQQRDSRLKQLLCNFFEGTKI